MTSEVDPPSVELKDPDSYSRPTAECDIVMKGGITSGVIYPFAVCQLGLQYRFKNVGGASAGAIAAGAAAAAELGRPAGLVRLAQLPGEVGGILGDLFQPTKETRPPFQVLMAWLKPRDVLPGLRRVFATVLSAIRWHFLWFVIAVGVVVASALIAAVTSLGLPLTSGQWGRVLRGLVVPTVVVGLPAGLIATAAGVAWTIFKRAPGNYFGLCNGMPGHRNRGKPALTPWLAEQLALMSGHSGVLTFGDLWGEEAAKEYRQRLLAGQPIGAEERRKRKVNLEVMTTNLTTGAPLRLPFDSREYAFCPACFAKLFPADVATHMDSAPAVNGPTATCDLHPRPEPLKWFPIAPDLPVVVAVRMSLSFPVLISAVPLHLEDFSRAVEHRGWVRAWFSDGGISSNFPIHFFDALFPVRPTFGIDLKPAHPDYDDPNHDPFNDYVYYRGPKGTSVIRRTRPADSLGGFLGLILDTMQNWKDSSLLGLPGFKDRVVTVRHTKKEGGLNLRMDRTDITRLAHRGRRGAVALGGFDLDHHMWVRYRSTMSELDEALTGMKHAYDARYKKFLETYDPSTSDYPKYLPDDNHWPEEERDRTADLMEVAGDWIKAGNPSQASAPRPNPELRIDARD